MRQSKRRLDVVNLGSDLTPDEIEFGAAMERYKRRHNPYPTYAEVLAVAKSLGYSRRVTACQDATRAGF